MANVKSAHWLDQFRGQPEDVLAALIAARDELARQKAAEAGVAVYHARALIEQMLNRGLIKFTLRFNLLDELDGVDVHHGDILAKGRAFRELKHGTIG
ncbi:MULTISPECIES: hypothetical protein [Rhodomicrobium]|uniref:hypothetical protein n=1 Tax=Rhodomicrobium TaxID=1068 RepID=UPI000F7367FC|nr:MULTISPECIES: hypothetical protein [Rhodomicrobium]